MTGEATMAINGRGILRDRPEHDWHHATPEQLRRLAASATRWGESDATVNGLVGWLTRQDSETASHATATRYRRILRDYGPPDGRGRRPQKGVARNADNPRGVKRRIRRRYRDRVAYDINLQEAA